MKKSEETIKDLAMKEFKETLSMYILPLLDLKGNLTLYDVNTHNKQLIEFSKDEIGESIIKFYPCIPTKGGSSPFYYETKTYSFNSLKKPAENILRELIKVTEYNCMDFSKQRDYGTKESRKISYKKRTLELAFELGICKSLTKTEENATVLHTLISRLLDWSNKTYEGKKISFGFAIDFDRTAIADSANYLHFLENDSSAAFTDGIFSGILLDEKGGIVSFLTKSSVSSSLKESEKEIFIPYQFSDIAKICSGSTIGVIALANGEIILIKKQQICFAKRGSKWIAFDWHRVNNSLRPYFLLPYKNAEEKGDIEKEITEKIKQIYCTILDVSFAHSGGCLALVIPEEKEHISEAIKERIDLYATHTLPPKTKISKESQEKIKILTYLLRASETTLRSFFNIEKPLRKEILSLDGATVVSLSGDFYCAGSIVSVPSGSSGGGRTAAAKKLANYGVGIKISEDGYIEAYGKNLNSSKPRIIPLFKFK